MQPECAGKGVREDDPDAEAGKILTASEGLEAVPIPSAEDAIYFDELMNGVLIVGNHASFSAAIGFDELMDGSNGSGLMPIGSSPMSIDAIMFLESLSLPELVLGTPMAVPVAPLPMMVTTESVGAAVFACWGAELMGTAVHCTLGFVSGKAHFKNKFCARCRQGINVPVRRKYPRPYGGPAASGNKKAADGLLEARSGQLGWRRGAHRQQHEHVRGAVGRCLSPRATADRLRVAPS